MVVEIAEMIDPAEFAEYRERVGPILAAHGAKMIALSDQIEVLNGDWRPNRLIIFEFENQERIREWHDSDAYQAIIPLRDRSANLRIVSVSGI